MSSSEDTKFHRRIRSMSVPKPLTLEELLDETAMLMAREETDYIRRAQISKLPGFLGSGAFSVVFKAYVKLGAFLVLRAVKINYRHDDGWRWLQFCMEAHKKYKGQRGLLAYLPEVHQVEWRDIHTQEGAKQRSYYAVLPIYQNVKNTELGSMLRAQSVFWEKAFADNTGLGWMHTDIHDGNWMMCPRRGLMLMDPIMKLGKSEMRPKLPLFAGRDTRRSSQSYVSRMAA